MYLNREEVITPPLHSRVTKQNKQDENLVSFLNSLSFIQQNDVSVPKMNRKSLTLNFMARDDNQDEGITFL